MKKFLAIVALTCWSSHAQAAEAAATCQKPDQNLIKHRDAYISRTDLPDAEKIERYNQQVRTFNECTRALVTGNNAEIDRLRDEGNARIAAIRARAQAEIGDIQAKMRLALTGAEALSRSGYPAPDCRKPDKSVLARDRKASVPAQYDLDQKAYDGCVRDYLAAASVRIDQVIASANSEIRQTADDANSRIRALQAAVHEAIASSDAAAHAKAQAVEGTPLARNDPVLAAKNAIDDARIGNVPARSVDTPTGEGDPRAVTCRAQQQLADSRLPGPEVCKRNRVWAALRKRGKDIASDGRTIVDADVKRQTNPTACTKLRVPNGVGGIDAGTFNNDYCN
jgi:hypothetical protein